MRSYNLQLVIIIVMALIGTVDATCQSTTYYASSSKKYIWNLNYENNELCTIYIRPNAAYTSGHYLEIRWDLFEVEGYMPSCSHDYVEVFLTLRGKSIGRYCSDNIGVTKLFTMYSSDGYAALVFKTDSSVTRRGFKFTFQLKGYNTDFLNTYGSINCYYNVDSKYAGTFYPSGWPKGYKNGLTCYHSLNVEEKRNTRIVVMDLNLRNTSSACNDSSDYVQIRESSNYYSAMSVIRKLTQTVTGKLCGTYNPGFTTATNRYPYIVFNRPVGSYPSHTERGFITGYITYSTDICFQNPCINGGTCVAFGNSRTCSCPPGFTGTLCQFGINECQSDPCQNGGTCEDKVNKYICSCSSGYTGKHCETKSDKASTDKDKDTKTELILGIGIPVAATVIGVIGYIAKKYVKRNCFLGRVV